MAAVQAVQTANPIYHDPNPGQTRTRTRRSSSRMSFASSLSRSASQLDSPRAICSKDGDTFSYDAEHLRNWYMSEELWKRLPADLLKHLAAVQHSGAAVLTGFSRLDKHTKGLDGGRPDHVHETDLFAQLDDLPPPKYRTTSNAGSVFGSDFSSPATAGSQSGCTSPVTSSFSQSQTMSPVALSPLADALDNRSRSRERSFSTPLESHDAYYATELSVLRTEALPRLRHLGRKVDTEWYEMKRMSNILSEDVNAFENWWAEKKCNILSLNEKGKRLASASGLANTGMGWCAP